MLTYTTGDLLKSDAKALVNTVNCEGYMGKGIAYQFKLQFPENNISYINACKNGNLKIGTLHYYKEKEKLYYGTADDVKSGIASKVSLAFVAAGR